jgi:hypothetical protein
MSGGSLEVGGVPMLLVSGGGVLHGLGLNCVLFKRHLAEPMSCTVRSPGFTTEGLYNPVSSRYRKSGSMQPRRQLTRPISEF